MIRVDANKMFRAIRRYQGRTEQYGGIAGTTWSYRDSIIAATKNTHSGVEYWIKVGR